MKTSVRAAVLGLALHLLATSSLSGVAAAGSAPDSAAAAGLFPVGRGGQDLSLVWESLTVSPGPDGCKVERRYRVRCRGRGGTYRFATATVGAGVAGAGAGGGAGAGAAAGAGGGAGAGAAGDSGSTAGFDSLVALAWNGAPLEYWDEPGRIEFEVRIRKSEVGDIDLQYFVPLAGEAALRFGIEHASLYGEAFWTEYRIPRIDVRFAPKGFPEYPAGKFLLEEPYASHARVEGTGASAALVWSIRNYRADQEGPAPVPLLAMPEGLAR